MDHSTSHSLPAHRDIHTTEAVLCHFGELVLKGNNRSIFEQQVMRSIRATLRQFRIKSLRHLERRLLIEFADGYPWDSLAARLCKVIGIANAYPVEVVAPTWEAIVDRVRTVVAGRSFESFAVACRRLNKSFPLRSRQICEQLGAMVQELSGARVDLDHPAQTIWLQVLKDRVLIAIDKVQGAGGLPVGTGGRVMVLLSGGIDSPVAAWRMMRRGCTVLATHFHSYPFTPAAATEKVERLAGVLAGWHGGAIRLATVPFGDIQQQIVAKAPDPLRVVLYRRLMVRIAAALARQRRVQALVTGDALAQVASQTLSNLVTIEAAAELPILRPLIGMDKEEITRTARQIGTYAISIEPHADCCQFMEPHHPATHSYTAQLLDAEAALDMPALVAQGVAGTTWRQVEESE